MLLFAIKVIKKDAKALYSSFLFKLHFICTYHADMYLMFPHCFLFKSTYINETISNLLRKTRLNRRW